MLTMQRNTLQNFDSLFVYVTDIRSLVDGSDVAQLHYHISIREISQQNISFEFTHSLPNQCVCPTVSPNFLKTKESNLPFSQKSPFHPGKQTMSP